MIYQLPKYTTGVVTYYVSKFLVIFKTPPPVSNCLPSTTPPPNDVSIFQTPPPILN